MESKKRKKQHLKKAEEIRNTQSVANEVDKARAMVDNLDQEAPVMEADPDDIDEEPEDEDEAYSGMDFDDIDEDIDEEFLEDDEEFEDDDDIQIFSLDDDEK